ncbi:hypothetical protein C4553_03340 [Candidatus Parcubacteria bacterium]|nr:MAG: hypothetical protein C4553_03340 [Candidatus Parcubacteria bacterium]
MRLVLSGFVILVSGLYLAFLQHSDIWYSVFLVGGFLFLEGINSQREFSIIKNKKRLFLTWLIFIIITVAVEIIGNSWLNLWDYLTFNRLEYLIHVIIIGYPLTGFFGLEFFVLLQRYFHSRKTQMIILPISAFLFGYLNEYPNVFASEWKYINWPLGSFLGIPILVSFLWILLLFVLLFKKPFCVHSLPKN